MYEYVHSLMPKDIAQKIKLTQKRTGKDKSLRKNIKQSCDENINNDPCEQ